VYGDATAITWAEGNFDADPRFADPYGPDNYAASWADNVYGLAADSPCIDTGNNAAVPADVADTDADGDTAEPTPLDVYGRPRFRDDPDLPDTSANKAIYNGGVYTDSCSALSAVNSIFWGNGDSWYYQATTTYSDFNGTLSGTGNRNADPLFVGDAAGVWSIAGIYDMASRRVIFTDTTATWAPNGLAGKFLNPNTSQALQFRIVANTTTTITILPDAQTIGAGSCWVTTGAPYRIYDYRLAAGSPYIDSGNNSALPSDDADADDVISEPLPMDLAGDVRNLDDAATADTGNGSAPIVDMGAYEFVPLIPFDFDGNGRVDEVDFAAMRSCVSGPGIPLAPGCDSKNLDGDSDIDLDDFGLFQRCYSGAMPANPQCGT
jgi:hypothetical protein